MDFKLLEETWKKQTLTDGELPAQLVIAQMKHEVQYAQRRIRGGIAVAAFAFIVGWAVTITAHLTSIKPFTLVALVAQITGSALYFAFFVRAFRSAAAVRNEMHAMGGTLHESTAATLRTVEIQIENTRIAAYAIPIVIAITTWLSVAQYLAGSSRGLAAVSNSALMSVLGAVGGAAAWYRYRMHLAPRRAELRELLLTIDGEDR